MDLNNNVLGNISKIVKSFNLPCDDVDVVNNSLTFFHCSDDLVEFLTSVENEARTNAAELYTPFMLRMDDFGENTTTIIINLSVINASVFNFLLSGLGEAFNK